MSDMRYRHQGVVRTVQMVEEEARPFGYKTVGRLPTLEDYDRQRDEGRAKWHNRCNSRRRKQDREAIYNRPWDRD